MMHKSTTRGRRRTPRYCFCRSSDYWFATEAVVRSQPDAIATDRCLAREEPDGRIRGLADDLPRTGPDSVMGCG
jgi:hypothetical protein